MSMLADISSWRWLPRPGWWWLWTLLLGLVVAPWLLPEAPERYHYVGLGWLVGVFVLLVLLNQGIHFGMNRYMPWSRSPQLRFFSQLALSLGLSLLLLNGTYWLTQRMLLHISPEPHQYYMLNLFSLVFLLPLMSAQVVSYLFVLWKRSALLSERLKQENIRTRLESLRNHLDPHFLFNNLNILSSLIDSSGEDAQEFLASFSEVYRYVLQKKGESLVSLREELAFIEAYLYMLEVRFRDQLRIDLRQPPDLDRWQVPPLALQTLVENAIKHNKASNRHPLHIEIFPEQDHMVVRNNLQPHDQPRSGSGTGLANLKSRYSYLTNAELQLYQDESSFEVRIPLLPKS